MKRIIALAFAALALAAAPVFMGSGLASASASTSASASASEGASAAVKKPKTELKEVTFHAHLHCEDCVKKVTENISFEKGVKDLDVSLENHTVWIKYDPSKTNEEKLAQAIRRLGYEVATQESEQE